MAAETTNLQPLHEDEQNLPTNINSMQTLSTSPPPMVPETSDLKRQLFELLKSADIEEADIKDYTTMLPMQKLDSLPNITEADALDNPKLENQVNSNYDKQILLEEAEMIHRLQEWIEQKGKPAILKVRELSMKTDQYEQEISSAKLELKALHDEMNKMRSEQNDLQSQYEAEKHRQSELVDTIDTLQQHTERNSELFDLDSDQKMQTLKQQVETLTQTNDEYKTEMEHIHALNEEYMTQNTSLKIQMESKDEQIKELIKDRDEWQNNAETRQNEVLERAQRINELNTENANCTHQIDLLKAKAGLVDDDKLTTGGTLRGLLVERSIGNVSASEVGDMKSMQKEKSGVFYANIESTANMAIYGASNASIMGHVMGKDSMDYTAGGLEKQIKEERNKHEHEVEELTSELETLKRKVEGYSDAETKYKVDIKALNGEIESLRSQNGGCNQCNQCNGCVVM
eukprot:43238_1